MSDRDMADPVDELVCSCMNVSRATLEAAIRNGATSVEELQRQTMACTGCGTCRWDIEALIERLRAHNG